MPLLKILGNETIWGSTMTEKIVVEKPATEAQLEQLKKFFGRILAKRKRGFTAMQWVILNGDRFGLAVEEILEELSEPIYKFVCKPTLLTVNYSRMFWELFEETFLRSDVYRHLVPEKFKEQPIPPQLGKQHGVYRIARFGDVYPKYKIPWKKAVGVLKADGWALADPWALSQFISNARAILPVDGWNSTTTSSNPKIFVGPFYDMKDNSKRAVYLQNLKDSEGVRTYVDLYYMRSDLSSGDYLLVQAISP